jgi:hypothetical protein
MWGFDWLPNEFLPIAVVFLIMLAARAYAITTRRTNPKQWRAELWSDLIWAAAIVILYWVDPHAWPATGFPVLWILIAAMPAIDLAPRLIRWAFRDRWAGPGRPTSQARPASI